jgi:hypothetical protein
MHLKAVCVSGALVIALQDAAVQRPPAGGQNSPPTRYAGFIFAPGRCDPGAKDCELRKPKPWAGDDIATVKRAIDEILGRPMGKAVIEGAQRRGFLTLERYTAAGLNDASGEPYPPPGPAAALHRNLYSIDLYDRYFAKSGLRDPFSGKPGYLEVAEILLHECFHAVDNLSGTAGFRNLLGFTAGSRFKFAATTEADVLALTEFGRQVRDAARHVEGVESRRASERLRRANRALALGMDPVRGPTMQSFQSPAEAFAEIGSHLVLDPRARTYLPRETVAYFDKLVLQ